MAETLVLEGTSREGTGKGAARAARREGLVPGVIYGGGKDPVTINVPFNKLLTMLRRGKFLSTLMNLKIDGEEHKVICRAVQRDTVKDLPTHVDFLRLSDKSRINLYIPVVFENEDKAPGLKSGGVLTIVRPEVELKVTANNIPEQLVVDLEGYQVGDTINISNVSLPAGTRPMITDRDFVIANIQPPSGLASQKDDEDDGETEVIAQDVEPIKVDE